MKFFLPVTLLLAFLQTQAQDIVLKGGLSLPSGSYSNANIQKADNRFATAGAGGSLAIRLPVYKRISLLAEAGMAYQQFDEKAYQAGLAAVSPGVNRVQISKYSDYRASFGLVGADIRLNSNRLQFHVSVQAGFLSLSTPAYSSGIEYPSNTGYTYTESQTITAPVYAWGISAEYPLLKKLKAGLYLQHLSANPEIRAMSYTSSSNTTNTLKFDVYQPGLMIVYSLN